MRRAKLGGLVAVLFAGTAMPQTAIPLHDLGVKRADEQHELTLLAQNVNCETPQDFEFELDNMPWLSADGPLIVRGLGPGQSQSIKATLDFRFTPQGVHYGRVTSRCITCGWYVFASCNEHGNDVVLKVTVNDPAVATTATINDINPYAGMTPRQQIDVTLVRPVSDENRRVLKSGDRKELDAARAGLRAVEARGQTAQERLSAAQRKKSDCERILARLKAEADAAKRAAESAKQQSKDAAKASKAARQSLESFERDNRKALKKVDDTARAVLVAARYRNEVEAQDGTGSGRYQRAQEQVDRFNDEHFAALREHTAVAQSRDQRKAAAEQAEKDAETAKALARSNKTAAETAERRAKDQEKICKGETEAVATAQQELDAARKAAKEAVREANRAETKAAGQAAERLEDRIKRQRQKCERMERQAKAEIAKWQEAIAAGQRLKILDADGGRAASALQAINDKIWATAQDLAQDQTLVTVDDSGRRGLSNDETADLASADTAEDVLERVTTLMGWAVEELGGRLAGGRGVPDVGQGQILNGMKALGMGVQNLVNTVRNPNTNFAQRNEMLAELKGEESYLQREMREQGIGKNLKQRKEILGRIDKLFNDRNHIADLVEKQARDAAKCAAELRDMEGRLAELRSQAKAGVR